MISGEQGRAGRGSPHPDQANADARTIRVGNLVDGGPTVRLGQNPTPQVNASADTVVFGRVGSGADSDDTVLLDRVRPAPGPDDTVLLDRVRPAPGPDDTVLLDRIRDDLRRPLPRHRQEWPRAGLARTVARTTGELMVTFGLVMLLFAAYVVWGKAAIVAGHQSALDAQLEREWAQDPVIVAPTQPPGEGGTADPVPPPVPPGGTIGRLYLPRLDNYWIVVEGVDPADIEYAPGHYPETAMPGQVGNFSVAGHRSPAIFWDLDRVQQGDAVVMETRTHWYVYRVTQSFIVPPTAVEVVAPVPGQPGATPSEAFLTITTCNPKWDNYERLIVHAKLVRVQAQDQAGGRPAELAGL